MTVTFPPSKLSELLTELNEKSVSFRIRFATPTDTDNANNRGFEVSIRQHSSNQLYYFRNMAVGENQNNKGYTFVIYSKENNSIVGFFSFRYAHIKMGKKFESKKPVALELTYYLLNKEFKNSTQGKTLEKELRVKVGEIVMETFIKPLAHALASYANVSRCYMLSPRKLKLLLYMKKKWKLKASPAGYLFAKFTGEKERRFRKLLYWNV